MWLGGRVRGTSDLSQSERGSRSPHSHTLLSHFPFSESTEELPGLLWEARPEEGVHICKRAHPWRGAQDTPCPTHVRHVPHESHAGGTLSPAPVLALRPQPGPLICPSFWIPWPSAPLLVWGLVYGVTQTFSPEGSAS